MNISTGTGGQAWQPARVLLEAYAPGNLTVPAERLGPELITVEVQYGPLGAVRGMALGLKSAPQAWRDAPYSRLIRLKLISEHGEGYVASGVLEQVSETPGSLTQARVLGVHDVYAGAPTGAGNVTFPLRWPGLIETQRLFGVPEPYTEATAIHQTREAYLSQKLEAHPNSEWGVGADLVAVMGLPESAPAAAYTVDSRALGLRPLGHTITHYVTDWTMNSGDGWQKFTSSRPSLGPFVPRRTGQAQSSTYERTEYAPVTWQQPIGQFYWQGDTAGDSDPREWTATAFIAPDSDRRRVKRVTVRVGIDLAAAQPTVYERSDGAVESIEGAARIYLTVTAANGWRSSTTITPLRGAYMGYWTTPVDLPGDALHGTVNISVMIGGGRYPDVIGGSVVPADVMVVYETPQQTPLEYPEGWTAPAFVGPTYEFTLPGWHVPPLRVMGLPGGLSQYVAGAVVTWRRDEASTRLLTAALPYPGQRRS